MSIESPFSWDTAGTTTAERPFSFRHHEQPASADSAFGGLLEAYRGQGRQAGYARAISDVRSGLLLLALEFARKHHGTQVDAGDLLEHFESALARELDHLAAGNGGGEERGYVADGLGI